MPKERGKRPGGGAEQEISGAPAEARGGGSPAPAAEAPGGGSAHPAAIVIVAARNEADRIGATLDALGEALPGCVRVVADDASSDGTAEVAMRHGAEVVSRRRPHGKGANVSAAAESVRPLLRRGSNGRGAASGSQAGAQADGPTGAQVVLLCDADLGSCAGELRRLVDAVRGGECELAVASFRRRLGGGFGLALAFARWAIRRRCGAETAAPISGQRALSTAAFENALPFAPGYGMEIGITIDTVQAGMRLGEYELDLEHRATGRSLRGFWHRARQLRDFARAYLARRRR